MQHTSYLGLLFCALTSTCNASAKACLIASTNNRIIFQEGDCAQRYTPASTFKIPISLMGFDAHILIDETHPTWDFTSGYVDWLEQWKQPHNPKLWLANSCVWYSQVITKKLGEKQFSRYTKRL